MSMVVLRFLRGWAARFRAGKMVTPVAVIIVLLCFSLGGTLADSGPPRKAVLRVLAWPGYADDDSDAVSRTW